MIYIIIDLLFIVLGRLWYVFALPDVFLQSLGHHGNQPDSSILTGAPEAHACAPKRLGVLGLVKAEEAGIELYGLAYLCQAERQEA